MRQADIPIIAIEAYSTSGGERYADVSFNLKDFGKSLPPPHVHKYFGFDANGMTKRLLACLYRIRQDPLLRKEFQKL